MSTVISPTNDEATEANTGEAALAAHICPNCGHHIDHPLPNYCGHCGQETRLKPPTVVEFLQQFGGSIIATEGALWRTLNLLLLHPGQLTREYFNGRRRHYILPLRLFITISVITLVLMRIVATLQTPSVDEIEANINVPQSASEGPAVLEIAGSKIVIDNGKFECKGLPPNLCLRLKDRFTLEPKAIAKLTRELPEHALGYAGSAMFLLLPLFASLLKIVYFRRDLRWTEHLIFALHLHAFWFIILIVQLSGFPAVIAIPFYSYFAARRVYGGSRWSTLLRMTGVGLIYASLLILALLTMLLAAFLFG